MINYTIFMVFTTFKDKNNDINKELMVSIFGQDSQYVNDNIFINKDICVSGSAALQAYNKYILKNEEDIIINDIDIYIQCNTIYKSNFQTKLNKMNSLFFKLLSVGYQYKNYKNDSTSYLKIQQQLKNTLQYKKYWNKNSEERDKYFSLFKFIALIFTLNNPLTGKNIDIIITKCHIKKLLINSFDFDIIKNYYSNGKLHILNPKSINDKIANMTLNHLNSRVFNNFIELNNFIKRYTKYNNRGYTIHIDNNKIPYNFIIKLQLLLHMLYNIDSNGNHRHIWINNCKYLNNKVNYHLMDFYYKIFYIHKELIEYVYHPNNIFKNEYLLNDYEE